jgi:hypothetical protein
MDRARAAFFRPLEAHGLRRVAAFYLLAFLTAVTVAPHRHVNSIEDLISDGPSDSGIFVERPSGQVPESGPSASAARWIDDDPCLACFLHDCVAQATAVFLFNPDFEPLALTVASPLRIVPAASARSTRSRAPPQ